jgi:glycosyltransferase involved in cell wall biosynthesis
LIENLISVIVPCYNQGRFLTDALNSVLQQTYIQWECIIINDGSTDNTEAVAKEFCRNDDRFLYEFQSNKGLSYARNLGIKISKGEFLQFLDADDILFPAKFEEQIRQFSSGSNTDVSVTGYRLFRDDPSHSFDTLISLKDYNCSFEGFLFLWNYEFVFPPVCCLIKKEFIEIHNIGFSESLQAFEDWVFWIRLCSQGAHFSINKKKLAFYRRHDSNMSADINHMSENLFKASFEIYEMLDNNMKQIFIQKIDKTIVHTIKDLLKYDLIYQRAESGDYQLGHAILSPVRYINRISGRILNKLRKLL